MAERKLGIEQLRLRLDGDNVEEGGYMPSIEEQIDEMITEERAKVEECVRNKA